MTAQIRDRAFASPIHVMPTADGGIRLLLPDGHSISLTTDAVARSAALLTRAAVRTGKGRRKPRPEPVYDAAPAFAAEVIAVDFGQHSRHA